MKHFLAALAFASLAVFAQDKQAPDKMDPARNKALENALKNFKTFSPYSVRPEGGTPASQEGPCVFIATVPVNGDADKGIVLPVPRDGAVYNMPVMKPPPTCPAANK